MERLAGKTALVTAAGQGIGFASAVQMAGEGATVYATDVNAKLLDNFKGIANIVARRLDVLDDAAVRATIEELPALDVLFNCAGYVHNGTITRGSPVRLQRDGVVISIGTITSLKRFKDDVREVQAGIECGIGLSDFQDLKPGDIIETYELKEIPRG